MKTQRVQDIYDLKLNESRKNIFGRIKSKLLQIEFNKIKKSNPIIETTIGKFTLQLPFAHELPFILKRSPFYSTNLARIAKIAAVKYHDFKLIDIGANVGDSVALLRTEATFPILCIEGDNYFFNILQKNAARFSDIHLSENYVGESNTELNVVSKELGGTAHLTEDATGTNKIYVKKLSSILEDNMLFQEAKMIKIDTDGFDNNIIRGSIDYLKYAKPIIFFEYDPFFLAKQNDDRLSIFTTLRSLGYEKLLIYENDGEYMISVDSGNITLLEDIDQFYTGRRGFRYCDICAFHAEDNDLFDSIRRAEIQFFADARK